MSCRIAVIWLLMLASCTTLPPQPPAALALLPADAILQGEQHDDDGHAQQHRLAVQALAERGALAALALEMAELGQSTRGLPPQASEAEVRAALHWDERAWPWARYAPAVMAAVRAGVPVLGANQPRAQVRAAMGDAALDRLLPDDARQAQQQAIRQGHCGLLPEPQVMPMTRVQIARDRAMAQAVQQAAVPGKTVLLVAGAQHVDPTLGVPRHLPAGLQARSLALPAMAPAPGDPCVQLREQWQRR